MNEIATVRNPFENETRAVVQPVSALISVEQQRAVAEVQARMIVARNNPRKRFDAMELILNDCTRPTLAEAALYQYSKGGTSISGASIKLAEAIAMRWGNIASGIKELSRGQGYSECVAYAWDLESGFYDERQFHVRHRIDTRSGGRDLTDERDIYELIANLGQRRKRAVLLTVLGDEVVNAAIAACEETLTATADTSPEALKRIVGAFSEFGVSQRQIETRCQCHLAAIRPAQVIQLRKIYTSLKDGMSEPRDWFPAEAELAPKPQGNEGLKETIKRQRRGKSETPPENDGIPSPASAADATTAAASPVAAPETVSSPVPLSDAASGDEYIPPADEEPPPPNVEPIRPAARSQADKDRATADFIISNIAGITDPHELRTYANNQAVKTPRDRWRANDDPLAAEVTAAFVKRFDEIASQ